MTPPRRPASTRIPAPSVCASSSRSQPTATLTGGCKLGRDSSLSTGTNFHMHSSSTGTPHRNNGVSPTQKLFGHQVQNTLPAHHRSFAPEWQRSNQEADAATIYTLETSKATCDEHAHPLSNLQVGNHVAVQNSTPKMWDIYGTITAVGPYMR